MPSSFDALLGSLSFPFNFLFNPFLSLPRRDRSSCGRHERPGDRHDGVPCDRAIGFHDDGSGTAGSGEGCVIDGVLFRVVRRLLAGGIDHQCGWACRRKSTSLLVCGPLGLALEVLDRQPAVLPWAWP